MCNVTREAPSLNFTTDAVPLNPKAGTAQVAGKDAQRRSVTVILDPDATDPVYVVSQQNQGQSSGVKLKPGAGLTLSTIAPVFVVAPTLACTVYVITETGAAL